MSQTREKPGSDISWLLLKARLPRIFPPFISRVYAFSRASQGLNGYLRLISWFIAFFSSVVIGEIIIIIIAIVDDSFKTTIWRLRKKFEEFLYAMLHHTLAQWVQTD